MSETNDGGRAFPAHVQYLHSGGTGDEYFPGMSLRDWFAGQAMQAMMTNDARRMDWKDETVSLWSYEMADAMIEARERRTE